MSRLLLPLLLCILLPGTLSAQSAGMAVDDGSGGLAMPTDGDDAGPMPEQPKSRNVQVISADKDSSPVESKLQNAFVAYKNGDYKAALTLIQSVQKSDPENAKAKLLEGRVLHAQRKYPEATEVILTAIEYDPKVPRAQYYLGEALLAQRKVLEARGAFAAQLKAEPKNKDALLLYAMCEAKLRNLQEARDAALELDPTDAVHPGNNFANAAIAQATGKPDEATREIDAARTTYGPKIWSRYMKYYLQVFPPGQTTGAPTESGAAPAKKATPEKSRAQKLLEDY